MPKAKNIKKYINKGPARPPGSRAKVEGPGVWVTCVKGKEKATIGELYDLFESLATELYPDEKDFIPQTNPSNPTNVGDDDDDDANEGEDLEAALARELKELKQTKTRRGTRFANARIDIICVVFLSFRPPIDPVRMIYQHMENVERTGVTHTRHALKYTPITDSCPASIPEIVKLAEKVIPPAFTQQRSDGLGFKYKIQITSRNHSSVTRNELIPLIAKCVPSDQGHSVDLDKPELTILIELYMFVCGMSVVKNYDKWKKFNALAIAEGVRKQQEAALEVPKEKANLETTEVQTVEGSKDTTTEA